MSFRGLFSSKKKEEKKQKNKFQLSPQELYELASSYLEEFSQLTLQNTHGDKKNKSAVDFMSKLHHDAAAVSCRSAIHEKFDKARCAENIDFLFNYFEMKNNIPKEQWQAFYHQYIEEEINNKAINFTPINLSEADSALFLQLNGKILQGGNDIGKVSLHFSGEVNKSYTGKTFMEHMAAQVAGDILGRDDLIIAAFEEVKKKALADGAVPTKEVREEKESSKIVRREAQESRESSKDKESDSSHRFKS